MKKIIFALLFPIICFAQNPGFELLKKINGVEIYYKATKTKEAAKKDTWIVEFEYKNTSGHDIFYKTTIEQPNSLDKALGGKEVTIDHFAVVFIENTKGMSFISDDKALLTGDKTRLSTDNNERIYMFKKGKTYTKSMDFRGDKGIEPIISIQIINSISFTENISEFL